VIAADSAAPPARPEPREARLLVATASGVAWQTAGGARKLLIDGARDAAYSPDGTLVAFTRRGDLWVANADGSGQRRLGTTPNVDEAKPAWLPDGSAVVYTATFEERRQIRLYTLPTGPSKRLAPSNTEEYDATVSRSGKLAFVSTRSGAPVIYTAQANGFGAAAFDTVPPATPFTDVRELAWSPDGTRLAYAADLADGTQELVVDDGQAQTPFLAGEHPVWSPGGARIAFATANGVASAAADGTDARALGGGLPLDWREVPAGTPRFPNLVQRPPSGLALTRGANGHWLLGFTSMVDNRGPGILWLRGARAPGEHVMQVRQLVQLGTGGTRLVRTGAEMRYVVAPPHYHWHLLGFDHYQLRSVGDFTLRVRDYKSGFCIADHWGHAIGVPHGPPRFLGNCEQFDPRATYVEEGSSVGYTDRYPAFFHGQQLDITRLPAGRYWLVHRANEDFHLRELRYSDNAASLLVSLRWTGGVPTVTPLRACLRERC
jgi:WD40 repeat protein